mgnify:CR=1 FL=1
MKNETPEAPLTAHSYDGIQEYDNPLPGWWKWIFVATIAFCPAYASYYHIGAPGRTIAEQYDAALAANTQLQFAEIGELKPDEATLVNYLHKDSWLKVGAVIFRTNCMSCHGRDGEGKVGPNLTDEFYKNVRTIEDIARIVNNGAGNGAMPAWSNRLVPNEVVLVSAYVASLRGQNLDGKGADGREIAPWPEPQEEPEAEQAATPTETTEDA